MDSNDKLFKHLLQKKKGSIPHASSNPLQMIQKASEKRFQQRLSNSKAATVIGMDLTIS